MAIQLCEVRSEYSECSGKCFGHICLLGNYSSDDPPTRGDNQTVTVLMQYDIDKVISVDTDLNVVGVQISLTQTWMDNRICIKEDGYQKDDEWVTAPSRMFKDPNNLPEIWIPSIWVFSMSSFETKKTYEDQSYLGVEKITTTSYNSNMLKEQDSSNQLQVGFFVHYLTQIDVYVKCPMTHSRFPFEEHFCDISITSSNLNMNHLKFKTLRAKWNNWGPEITNREKTRYFDVEITNLDQKEITISHDVDTGSKHNRHKEKWSLTGFRIHLTRRWKEFFVNFMLPAGLCVIISWITFLIPRESVEARVAVLITLQLVLVTIFNGAQEYSPRPAHGSSALDIWMLSMFFFVFVAFMAYSADLALKKRRHILKSKANKMDEHKSKILGKPSTSDEIQININQEEQEKFIDNRDDNVKEEDQVDNESNLQKTHDKINASAVRKILKNTYDKFDKRATERNTSKYGHYTDRIVLITLICSFVLYCLIYSIAFVI